MCNLYSVTKARDAIANQPPLPAVFPNQLAPVICRDREGAGSCRTWRALPAALKPGSRLVTNHQGVNLYTEPKSQ